MYLTKHKGFHPASFNTFFDDAFVKDFFHTTNRNVPATNIKESEQKFVIELLVPGWKKSDFKLEVKEKNFVVSAEHQEEIKNEGEKYTKKEFSFQSFQRAFRLPENINTEGIKASYDNGVLVIDLPKREVVKQDLVKRIEVL